MSGQGTGDVCDRGCCEWDSEGAVTRYAEHADCRYCGMEAEGRDPAGRACCGLCANEHGLDLERLPSWRFDAEEARP